MNATATIIDLTVLPPDDESEGDTRSIGKKRRREEDQDDDDEIVDKKPAAVVTVAAPVSATDDSNHKNNNNVLDDDTIHTQAAAATMTKANDDDDDVFDCPICLEQGMERFRGFPLDCCGNVFCRECLFGYIQSKLNAKDIKSLVCPIASCCGNNKSSNDSNNNNNSSPNKKKQKRMISSANVRACTLEVGEHEMWRIYQEQSTEAFLDFATAATAAAEAVAETEPTTAAAMANTQQQDQDGASSVGTVEEDDDELEAAIAASLTTAASMATTTTATNAATATTATTTTSSMRRCPTEHCNFTFEFEPSKEKGGEGHCFICPSCEEAYCLNCPVVGGNGRVGPPHDYYCHEILREIQQSEERQRKLQEWKIANSQVDARFQDLLRREKARGLTQPCPNCQTPITKNGGCSHMHCTNCNTDFNWSGV